MPRISEIAQIRGGYQFRGSVEDSPDGTHHVIQIRDFDRLGRLVADKLARVKPNGNPAPYLAEHGDVLFLSRGHRLWATALRNPPEDSIVSGYFFMVRPTETTIRPQYLAWYLNQAPFQSALRPFVRGTHMPLISQSDFAALPVEVPALAVQESIVELSLLGRREQELLSELQTRRKALVDATCLQAARSPHGSRRKART